MSHWQRIKSVIGSVLLLLMIPILLFMPQEQGISLVAFVLSLLLIALGVRVTWFYFRMARHMVGGKMMLCQGILLLDIGLFSVSVITTSKVVVLGYLLAVFAFSGGIDILRALEAKRYGAPSWKLKLISGCVTIAAAAAIGIAGFCFGSPELAVYGYCVSLLYLAVVRLIAAFRKTAVIYIA